MRSLSFAITTILLSSKLLGQSNYPVDLNVDATHCELFVDGFGSARIHYQAHQRSWFETFIRVDKANLEIQGDEILGVGVFIRYDSFLLVKGDQQFKGTNNGFFPGKMVEFDAARNLYKVDFTTSENGYSYDQKKWVTNEYQPRQIAFYLDVRRDQQNIRLWMKNGSRDFTLEEIIGEYPTVRSPLGLGGIHYLLREGDSPLFSARKRCM